MDQPVITSYPHQPFFQWAFICCKYGTVIFYSRIVLGNRAPTGNQLIRIVPGEVTTKQFPTLAFICAHVNMIGKGVELFRVVFAKNDGEIPLEAIFHSFCSVSHGIIGPYIDRPYRICFVVNAG